ncbi:MAG: DUF427 domain-containing protein [Bacteroidia bacterium]|nr:DUF427 domain-containing protein [Bacteroidia bacterium]MCC6767628.1 DUF427 domain-containing protein [Bacteroidia bacterium]
MVKALWKGTVIAESDRVIQMDGKRYFPHVSINPNYYIESEKHAVCPVKGRANYYHLSVNGNFKSDGAYYFPNPNPKVKVIQNYIGFDGEIEIREE